MAGSILNADIQQHLSQERSRLMRERDTIVALVTTEIDQVIELLNTLLGTGTALTAPHSVESASVATAPAQRPPGRPKATATVLTSPTGKATTSAQPKPSSSAKQGKRKAFDPKQLKGDFKGMAGSDAISQVMRHAQEQAFTTDELIEELYETVAESDRGRARKSIAASLMHGMRAGKFDRVQDNPARYKLGTSMTVSS